MNNTYNRILDLVVNERLEEGKKWDTVKKHAGKAFLAGALTVGAGTGHALKRHSGGSAASPDAGPPSTEKVISQASNTISQVRSGMNKYDNVVKRQNAIMASPRFKQIVNQKNKARIAADPLNKYNKKKYQEKEAETHGIGGQVEGQEKPVGGLSPHPKLGKYGVNVA